MILNFFEPFFKKSFSKLNEEILFEESNFLMLLKDSKNHIFFLLSSNVSEIKLVKSRSFKNRTLLILKNFSF